MVQSLNKEFMVVGYNNGKIAIVNILPGNFDVIANVVEGSKSAIVDLNLPYDGIS